MAGEEREKEEEEAEEVDRRPHEGCRLDAPVGPPRFDHTTDLGNSIPLFPLLLLMGVVGWGGGGGHGESVTDTMKA